MFMPLLKDFELIINDLKKHLDTPNIEILTDTVKLDMKEHTFNGYKVIKQLGKGAQG